MPKKRRKGENLKTDNETTLKEKKLIQLATLYAQSDEINRAKLDAVLATFSIFSKSGNSSNQISS